MPRTPLIIPGTAALLTLVVACPAPLASPPAPAPVEAVKSTQPAVVPVHDLAPLELTPTSARYDMAAMGNPGFDGSASDSWLHRGDQLCRKGHLRPIIVDIDHTAIDGNFIRRVEVNRPALETLKKLDTQHGVLFLTANFAIDRIRTFFDRTGYPDAPILSRPRNYWNKDYDDWCRQASRFAICETAFKLDSLEQLRQRCPQQAERMVGLGDKFSDYESYLRSGLCPLILTSSRVDKANRAARDDGCRLDSGGRYAWKRDDKALGERCALVPERYLVRWDQVEAIVNEVLSGQVECGAWGEGTTR